MIFQKFKVAVCTAVLASDPDKQIEYESKYAKNIDTHKTYCALHGYDYICARSLEEVGPQACLEPIRPFAWYKILLVLRLVQEYDLVLWVDTDAAFNNLNVKIEDLLPFMANQHLCLASLTNLGESHIQSGVFLLRKHPESRKWLTTIWEQEQFINSQWWDQMAIIHLFQTCFEWAARLSLLSDTLPLLQCYPTHNQNKESLIIHYPGALRSLMPPQQI